MGFSCDSVVNNLHTNAGNVGSVPGMGVQKENNAQAEAAVAKEIEAQEKKKPKTYMFPPLSRLAKGVGKAGDSTNELKETALRLQQTLNTFGVKVTITDISQGPSVTRYELQPEPLHTPASL